MKKHLLPDGRRRLPDKMRITEGVVRRAGRKWVAEVAVVGFQARTKASAPGLAVRRAFDAALDALLKAPLPEESGPPKVLGERLTEARRRAGLTQAELAEAMGDRYDQTVISAVERGRSSLRPEGVVRVARALDLSADWLLGLTDAPGPPAKEVP